MPNAAQRIVLAATIVAVLAAFIVQPKLWADDMSGASHNYDDRRSAGYAVFFQTTRDERPVVTDYAQMQIEYATLVILSVAAYALTGIKKREH